MTMPKDSAEPVARHTEFDALLFDKDGTLFDFHLSWSEWTGVMIKELAAGDVAVEYLIEEALRYDVKAMTFEPDSPVIAGTTSDIADVLLPVLSNWTHKQLMDHLNEHAARVTMAPAVPLRPLLERLRREGFILGVATNAGEFEATSHLTAAGIADLFDLVIGFDSGHGSKPEPGMCIAFAEHFDLEPSRVAMIGDSLHDLRAGRSAEMRTVGVLTGLADRETLTPHADAVLPDISHLPHWLSQER